MTKTINTPDNAVIAIAVEALEDCARRIASEKFGTALSLVSVAEWLQLLAFGEAGGIAADEGDLTIALGCLKRAYRARTPDYNEGSDYTALQEAAGFIAETRSAIAERERNVAEQLKRLTQKSA